MPDEPMKDIEVSVPEIKPGTVSFLNKSAFNNPAPAKLIRIFKALNYFCATLVLLVGGTDLFSGRQAKIIAFCLGAFMALLGAIETAIGVKPAPDIESNK